MVDKVQRYQHQEDDFERFKDETEIGLFLEQGLGKSVISLRIAIHKYRKGEIDAVLVIAPNDVHRQWANEQVPEWLTYYQCDYEVKLLGGKAGAKKSTPFYKTNALHIVCVNIDTFSTPAKWMDIVEWANAKNTFIILDEATVIKNHKAKRTERLLYEFNTVVKRRKQILSSIVNSKARAVLTGTPVTNGPFDLWSIMEFVRPNYFGLNYYAFQNKYGIFYQLLVQTGPGGTRLINVAMTKKIWDEILPIKSYNEAYAAFGVTLDTYNYIQAKKVYEGPYRYADELKELLKPVCVFRKLEDCVDMPRRIYSKRALSMSPAQEKAYIEMQELLMTEYEGGITTARNKVSAAIRLQQIASGFIRTTPEVLDEENEDLDILPSPEIIWLGKSNPKLDAMYNDIEAAIPVGPIIIITRFSCEAARIYEDLADKYSVCLQTGWKKEGTIEQFQQGEFQVMVANIRVISRGFNLQIAHQMFFYSNTFSLEDRLQVESRIFRIGQQERCSYIDYAFENTIDEKIIESLKNKQNLLDFIRDTDNIKGVVL